MFLPTKDDITQKQLNSATAILAGPHLTRMADDGSCLITEPLFAVPLAGHQFSIWNRKVSRERLIRAERAGA